MFSPFHIYKLFQIQKITGYPTVSVSPLPASFIHGKQLILGNIPLKLDLNNASSTLAVTAVDALSSAHDNGLKRKSPNRNIKNRPSSFTVSYLIDSCGLSPEIAESVSKKVKFETPDRPNSVLELLKNNGFNQSRISTLVRKKPDLLLYNAEKTLLPKLNFFRSIGVSKFDMVKVLSYDPNLLTRSLENQIIPSYNFLKSVLGCDSKVVSVLRRTSLAFYPNTIVQNINFLREIAVPESSIKLALSNFPRTMLQKHNSFLEAVNKVKGMGFSPLKVYFMLAIQVISWKSSKLIWDRCFEAYKKWGWSEDDVLKAFKKHPYCMTLSEMKIERTMDFFVNRMGYKANTIAETPNILLFSLEKRIIPRCLVIQVLTSKGLIKELSLFYVLQLSEKIFWQRFVTKYEDRVPDLLGVYRGQIDILAP